EVQVLRAVAVLADDEVVVQRGRTHVVRSAQRGFVGRLEDQLELLHVVVLQMQLEDLAESLVASVGSGKEHAVAAVDRSLSPGERPTSFGESLFVGVLRRRDRRLRCLDRRYRPTPPAT